MVAASIRPFFDCKGGDKIRYVGIDIGVKACAVCVMDDKGDALEETSYPNTLKDATVFAQKTAERHGECRAVCESTGNMWLKSFDGFERAGIPIVLANPSKLKPISQASAKTDKIDAKVLARLLSVDMIPACHVPDPDVRNQKQLLRHRITLVQERTRASNRAGRLLDKYDVALSGTRLAGGKEPPDAGGRKACKRGRRLRAAPDHTADQAHQRRHCRRRQEDRRNGARERGFEDNHERDGA